jgi:hypothetical protein
MRLPLDCLTLMVSSDMAPAVFWLLIERFLGLGEFADSQLCFGLEQKETPRRIKSKTGTGSGASTQLPRLWRVAEVVTAKKVLMLFGMCCSRTNHLVKHGLRVCPADRPDVR